jgi:chorismate synthase
MAGAKNESQITQRQDLRMQHKQVQTQSHHDPVAVPSGTGHGNTTGKPLGVLCPGSCLYGKPTSGGQK